MRTNKDGSYTFTVDELNVSSPHNKARLAKHDQTIKPRPTLESAAAIDCSTCLYFRAIDTTCRRYPPETRTRADNWCGEYARK